MHPYHIIIAEDDPANRKILQMVLTRDIYPDAHYTLVEDGQAALLAFEQTGADLVITDFHMAKMHGLDVVRKVRAQHATVPIILLSGSTLGERAREAGANHFMNYPFDIDEFEKIVRELLPPQAS